MVDGRAVNYVHAARTRSTVVGMIHKLDRRGYDPQA